MPGYEIMGEEEKQALIDLFDANGGILFAHGFDGYRKGIYKVREFEKKVSEHFGNKYCQAVSSGSAALLVALKALGIKPGDEVITQSFTFVATVEAIIAAGAVPVITEIDETFNIDPEDFQAKITEKTKVVIPVHMAGTAADMGRIRQIARENNIKVLEDAAQSSGTKLNGKYLGTIGDMGIFSLDFAKNFTCGEGGLILTNNEDYYQEARCFHDHGHEYNTSLPRGIDTRHTAGFNYRMSEMQAAVGIVQLGKLNYIVETQRKNKKHIKKALESCPVKFKKVLNPEEESGDTLIFTLSSPEKARTIANGLYQENIGTKNLPDAINWHFAGTWKHMLKDFYGMEDIEKLWPLSRNLLESSIALPINIKMSEEEKDKMVEVVARLVR